MSLGVTFVRNPISFHHFTVFYFIFHQQTNTPSLILESGRLQMFALAAPTPFRLRLGGHWHQNVLLFPQILSAGYLGNENEMSGLYQSPPVCLGAELNRIRNPVEPPTSSASSFSILSKLTASFVEQIAQLRI